MSLVLVDDGQAHGIALFRPPGERPFNSRDRRLLHLFHTELAPHLSTDLAPPGCDPVSRLSPRLRQVLACLLEGDSEHQTALRLGLTPATTHQYVKTVYQHFHVNSRAQLMARWIRLDRGRLLTGDDSI